MLNQVGLEFHTGGINTPVNSTMVMRMEDCNPCTAHFPKQAEVNKRLNINAMLLYVALQNKKGSTETQVLPN